MCAEKEKMKVAFIVDAYSKGGVSVVLEILLQFLVKTEAFDITLFVRNYNKNMRGIPEGVVICPWEDYQTISGAFRDDGIKAVCKYLNNILHVVLNFRNHGRKIIYKTRNRKMLHGKFDCAITYHMIPNDVSVMALEKIQATRRVLWLHFRKNISDKDKSFYSDFYSGADSIVGVSEETAKRFRILLPKCADKTIAIHNLYDIHFIRSKAEEDTEGMYIDSGAIKIVTVARLAREKGFERVPPVIRRLTDEGYDIQWYIIGEGDKRADIENIINENNVTDRIHLLGYRSNPYPYINNCDIYVQTSHMEGFCTSTMEAKILYKPVVTTDVPGMREQFLSGENGLIVESSEDGLYTGIKQLLDSPELRQKFIANLMENEVSNDTALRQTISVIEGTDEKRE